MRSVQTGKEKVNSILCKLVCTLYRVLRALRDVVKGPTRHRPGRWGTMQTVIVHRYYMPCIELNLLRQGAPQ